MRQFKKYICIQDCHKAALQMAPTEQALGHSGKEKLPH